MVIALIGSERFKNQIIQICSELESYGYAAFMPTFIPKVMLHTLATVEIDKFHTAQERKIDASDVVYVVDPYKYVGKDTQREINYAEERGKLVLRYSVTSPHCLEWEVRTSEGIAV